MPDNTNATAESAPVWLWDREPGTSTLVKVLVPAEAVPAEDLPALQRRYTTGDRVQFTYDDEHPDQTGTIVQDQGIFVAIDVAIDGDQPRSGFTIGKQRVQPLAPAPTPAPSSDRCGCLTASPHNRPDVRTDAGAVSACWDLGAAAEASWRRLARLHIYHAPGYGYLAVLTTVEERHGHGLRQQRHAGIPGTVVHVRATTRRPSATGLRTTLAEALTVLRTLFDTANADILCYFTNPATSPSDAAPAAT